ncbi:hypothetical protein ACVWYH_004326 [Bradyrhizobium sp. GM24.11]
MGQWRRPHLPPHHRGRRPLSLHGQGRGEQCRQRSGHALSVRADLAPRHAAGLRLLHPARRPDRLSRWLAGIRLQEDRRSQVGELQGHQWLARHDRQVLGFGAAARHQCAASGEVLLEPRRQRPYLPDRLSARPRHRRDRRHCDSKRAAVRRCQGSRRRRRVPVRGARRLQQGARAEPFRSLDRLGLVLLHHQADVPRPRLPSTASSAISAFRSCS